MRKTSVYLGDEEVEGLRRMAAATGVPQAQLVREGVRRMLETSEGGRVFHSMAGGRGRGYIAWDPDELYAEVMGRRGPDR